MPRQNTQLESAGAEFLVLGQLLIQGISAYKTYMNMAGYDLIAVNPQTGKAAKIQVKSRWRTGASGFPIKNFDSDFIVVVYLNRGSKDGKKIVKLPDYYVLPTSTVENLPRSIGWGKVSFKGFSLKEYSDKWSLITNALA